MSQFVHGFIAMLCFLVGTSAAIRFACWIGGIPVAPRRIYRDHEDWSSTNDSAWF
jgi:hypothetical protein